MIVYFDLAIPQNLSARRLRVYNVAVDPRVEVLDSGALAGSVTTVSGSIAEGLQCQAILTDTVNVTGSPAFAWPPLSFNTGWTEANQPYFADKDYAALARCGCAVNHMEDESSSSSSSTSSTSSLSSSSSLSSTSTSSLSSTSTSSPSSSSTSTSTSSLSSTSTSSLSSTSTSSVSSSSSSSS